MTLNFKLHNRNSLILGVLIELRRRRTRQADNVARELARLVQYRTMSEIRAAAEHRLPRVDRETILRALHEARDEEHPGWDEGLGPREY